MILTFMEITLILGQFCYDSAGCVCGNEQNSAKICEYAAEKCASSACGWPLKPHGHCCWNMCGAVVNLKLKPDRFRFPTTLRSA